MKWIPNSWNIRDSSPFTALDLTPTFPRDPVPCKDLELGFSQFFIPGIWDGVESWQSQRAPGSVVVPFLPFLAPHMEKTWDFPGNSRIFQETPRFSRIFREFRLFSLALGKRQESREFSPPFWPVFFGKLQQDLSSAPESLSRGNSHFIPA